MRATQAVLFAATALAQSQYGENHVRVTFDSQLVEQTAFPAPNETLYSPAFAPGRNASFAPGWFNGSEGATSQDDLSESKHLRTHLPMVNIFQVSFISGLAAKNPSWMSFRVADFTSEEGKPFPYIYLSTGSNVSSVQGDANKLRVWIQGSVHGNEPAGDEATLALLGAMDANKTFAASFLEKLDVVVLPRYNPDGNACM